MSAHPSRHEAYDGTWAVARARPSIRPAAGSAPGRDPRRCRRGRAGSLRARRASRGARPGPPRTGHPSRPSSRSDHRGAARRPRRGRPARGRARARRGQLLHDSGRRRAPLLPPRAEGVGRAAAPGGEDVLDRPVGAATAYVEVLEPFAEGGGRGGVGGRVEGDRSREDHGSIVAGERRARDYRGAICGEAAQPRSDGISVSTRAVSTARTSSRASRGPVAHARSDWAKSPSSMP